MSDLISRAELLKEFDPNGERIDPILVRSRIVQAPTAYDVEAVVEKLESVKALHEKLAISPQLGKDDKHMHTLHHGLCVKVIDIVRSGGKE